MKTKTYILDTNVLIQNPDSIFSFEDNNVVIADITIEELDKLKKMPGELGYNARKAIKNIENLRKRGDLTEGVSLDNGGTFKIEINNIHTQIVTNWDLAKADNRILQVAKGISEKEKNAILVSKDAIVRIKADVLKIKTADYTTEIVPDEYLEYMGRTSITVSTDLINEFYNNKKISYKDNALIENEFIILVDELNSKHTAIGRYTNGLIVSLLYEENMPFGIKPKNVGQKFALEALLSPATKAPLVILKGPAGTAKTFLSMACGLQKVVEEREYRKMLITRANVSFDNDIGALPGDEIDKVSPLIRGCLDNIELLVDEKSAKEGGHETELQDKVDEMFDRGYVDIQALGYLRGRSLTSQILLIDEAQNTTPNQMLGILTRAGEGTKIIISGDLDQIDNTKLDKHTNGLAFALEKMSGSPLCWTIGFSDKECTRSELAKEASSRMVDTKKQEEQ